LARAEAKAEAAARRARQGEPDPTEECPPAFAEVLAQINAYAAVVADAAIREAVPLPSLGGRPLTEEVLVGLDEFATYRMKDDLAGLTFDKLGGRGAVLVEMMNRVSEVDRQDGSWMGKAWPTWFEDIPAYVAEKACREAAEEEARRQRLAALPRRMPGSGWPEF
jgi:hypothetical protein